MKLIIDIPDKDYETLKDGHIPFNILFSILDVIQNGILIPDNATNGDMIKALFPRIKIKKFPTFLRVIEGEEYIPMTYDWWNSPYKRGDTE